MDSVFELLKVDKGIIERFPNQANLVVDLETEKIVNKNCKRLRFIENKFMSDGGLNVSPASINELISRVKDAAIRDFSKNIEWAASELRLISYNLSMLQSETQAFTYVVDVLRENWRNIFINGIVFYLISQWTSINRSQRSLVCNLLRDKLSKYEDGNRKYLVLKEHMDLFDDGGPLRLAMLLIAKKQPLNEAPLYIGYKPTALVQPYFSDVIINYFTKLKIDDLSLVEQVLAVHSMDRTKKLLFAGLIEKADQSSNEVYRGQVSNFANRIIGNVTLPTTWAPFAGATEQEIEKLRHSRELVNRWLAKQYIEEFFDSCDADSSRKQFWFNYINYVSDFKVVGSEAIGVRLSMNPKLAGTYRNFFKQTNSRTGRTSALILVIKGKTFVEFSDVGSLYVYDTGARNLDVLKKRSLGSINELKVPQMHLLIKTEDTYYSWEKSYDYNDDGRMAHSGYWQDRLNGWMFEKLGIDYKADRRIAKQTAKQSRIEMNNEGRAKFISPLTEFADVEEKEFERKIVPQNNYESVSMPQENKVLNVEVEISGLKIYSKWFVSERCRFCIANDGLYADCPNDGGLRKMKNMNLRVSKGHSLWITSPKGAESFCEIIFTDNKEYKEVVGLVKLSGRNMATFKDPEKSWHTITLFL